MAKRHTHFVCQTCGASYPKWSGRCANCGTWNSLVEQLPEPMRDEKSAVGRSQLSGKLLQPVAMRDL